MQGSGGANRPPTNGSKNMSLNTLLDAENSAHQQASNKKDVDMAGEDKPTESRPQLSF